jgi:hypothetical protein
MCRERQRAEDSTSKDSTSKDSTSKDSTSKDGAVDALNVGQIRRRGLHTLPIAFAGDEWT